MNSLFDTSSNNQLQERIKKLSSTSKPLWGKMNVVQMLSHLQPAMDVAFGNLKLKSGLMAFFFGKMAKKQLVNERPFKKNLPTVKEFQRIDPALSENDFIRERDKVLAYVDKFAKEGPSVIVNKKHPFFGNLADREWDMLEWKHLDHHLRQFGV